MCLGNDLKTVVLLHFDVPGVGLPNDSAMQTHRQLNRSVGPINDRSAPLILSVRTLTNIICTSDASEVDADSSGEIDLLKAMTFVFWVSPAAGPHSFRQQIIKTLMVFSRMGRPIHPSS